MIQIRTKDVYYNYDLRQRLPSTTGLMNPGIYYNSVTKYSWGTFPKVNWQNTKESFQLVVLKDKEQIAALSRYLCTVSLS